MKIRTVVLIVLGIILLGVLGFVVWQNFIAPQQTGTDQQTAQTEEAPEVTQNRVYENEELSFSYPETGWTLEEVEYTAGEPLTPELKTSDFTQTGMSIESGAFITVVRGTNETTIDAEYANLEQSAAMFSLENLQMTEIDGKSAITYFSQYEGARYHMIFVHNGRSYDVIYRYEDDGNAETHMSTYELVTSSITFKP
jgi:hypothetical protein